MSKILIAGAGIGGLTAAIALRLAGHEVEVFERAAQLGEAGAGIVLAMNALRGLQSLGVYDEVVRAGALVQRVAIADDRGRTLGVTELAPLVEVFGVAAVAYHRAELHAALLRPVRDVVRTGASVTSFAQDDEGVRITLADGTTAEGDLLVGADGLHSAVRAGLLGDAPPVYAGYTSWRGVTPEGLSLMPEGQSVESWGAGRRFGSVGLTRGRTYWFAVDDAPPGGRDEGSVREALLRLFAGWHAPIEALIEATPEAAVLRTDIHDRDPVDVWGAGRVTLLGDAAHPMTPNMGQGACQAIEDAVALGSILQGDATPSALRRYEALRQPRTRAVVMQSRRFGKLAQWSNPIARGARDLAMRAVPKDVAVRQLRGFLLAAPIFERAAAPPR